MIPFSADVCLDTYLVSKIVLHNAGPALASELRSIDTTHDALLRYRERFSQPITTAFTEGILLASE